MPRPSDLWGPSYCGPSRLVNLAQIPNQEGFDFIGIDKSGGEHDCKVHKRDNGTHYVHSYNVDFNELCGWLPKPEAARDS